MLKRIRNYLKKLKVVLFYCNKVGVFSKREKQTIIICFDGLFPHGGWVDRLKGIISFYEIAKQLKCDFKILYDSPFSLNTYLEPNEVKWTCSSDDFKINPFSTKVLIFMDDFNSNPIEEIKSTRAKTILIYSNVDYLKLILSTSNSVEVEEKWRNNFNELFSFSSFLNEKMKELPNSKRIVFHTRFTSLMGDFVDTVKKELTEKEKSELVNELLFKIREIAQSNGEKEVFVLSDSIFFLDYVKKESSFSVLEGSPKHIDVNNTDTSLESHTKTITDFFFMASSDTVYLLKQNGMHMSGFPKYAAIIGDKPFNVIV